MIQWMADLALLLLRLLGAGQMFYLHGMGKIFGFASHSASFPDPFGIGPSASMALVIFAEVGCTLLMVFGILTRLSSFPFAFTMLVASLMHLPEGLEKMELPLLYCAIGVALMAFGAGRLSLDHLVLRHLPVLRRWAEVQPIRSFVAIMSIAFLYTILVL